MISKEQFDRIFTQEYESILEYTGRAINAARSSLDPYSLISEAYLYSCHRREEMEEETQVISWTKTYIKNNIRWPNSEAQRRDRLRSSDVEVAGTSSIEITLEQYEALEAEFISTLTPYQRRLYDMYFVKNLRKGREIAEHLGFSVSSGYNILNQCKRLSNDYRKWLQQNIMI